MSDLIERMKDPNRRVRRMAVEEARDQKDDEAVEALGIALDDDKKLIRMQAIDALGVVGGPKALKLLLARMDDTSQPTLTRRMALDAVVKIGSPEAADALEARMDTFDSERGRKLVRRKVAEIRAWGPRN